MIIETLDISKFKSLEKLRKKREAEEASKYTYSDAFKDAFKIIKNVDPKFKA